MSLPLVLGPFAMKLLPPRLNTRLQLRKKLRRASGFQIAIAHRLRQLNVEDWRSVTAGQSFYFSPEYLQMIEAAGPANLEPRYALISDDDGPRATVCMQIVQVSLDHLGEQRNHKLKVPFKERVLICGNLLSYGQHGVCFAPGSTPAELWPAVAEALYRTRRSEKLDGQTNVILVKDILEADKMPSACLGELSYSAVETEPNMVLTLPEGIHTHDDYLASLASKYRNAVKSQIYKPFEAAGFRIERLEQVTPFSARLQDLYLQTHTNAKLRPFMLEQEYWSALALAAAASIAFHVAVKGSQIYGFVVTLKDAETAVVWHIGFDRETAANGVPLYLRLLHASLTQAIDFRCRRVSFGRTALAPKARIGCRPEPMQIWVRHRQPLLNQAIGPLLRLIQHEDAPECSPFKKTTNHSEGL
ncbi:putative N-acyltransferase [Paraburkholderia youngii]|uniref:GNAT family N-acetyltransferase n=1 Tax=Paraburkholderia TaxID=1822464 RepID=UPI0034CED86E